ncbi:MAG: M28 family peptidase [Anaerolineae bacterium]
MLFCNRKPPAGFAPARAAAQLSLEADLAALVGPARFREHLKAISSEPHPAASAANARVAAYLATVMREAGWQVASPTYDVYLPAASSSHVTLVTPIRRPLNQQENIHAEDPYSAHKDLGPAWLAYTGSGDVTGEVVYANYGRREDFDRLADLGVDLSGKVAIARYGGNFRGFKARYAEEAGAAALLIYSDPADGGYTSGPPYPEGRWLNDSVVQRGSLLTLPYPGDPLSPGQAALAEDRGEPPRRLSPDEVEMPGIPVAALPYASAAEILGRMAGASVPDGWQGGLPYAYRLEGGPDLTVRVQVSQTFQQRRITNVVGTLRGTSEPERWIVLGCHYDAWTFGAADPNSGTAMLLLLAEALGALASEGRGPSRSIVIGHWDAEELGVIGSVEWVEEWLPQIRSGAVAYLNADMAATGRKFGASGSPLLRGPLAAVADGVKALDGSGSAYEQWAAESDGEGPPWGIPGGGSDHVAFWARAGVPVAQASFTSKVPVYHSAYDNLSWYERFGDPEWTSGPALAALDGALALRLANADILPLDASVYAEDIGGHLDALDARAKELEFDVDLSEIWGAAERLGAEARAWQAARDEYLAAGHIDEAVMNEVNACLLALDRQFLWEEGLPDRPWYRSQYAAPDPVDGYGTWPLPALRHAVEAKDERALATWQGRLAEAIVSATALLKTARAVLA